MKTELIIALDVDSQNDALHIIESCGNCFWFKIGFQLFTRCGPDVVKAVLARNKKVFLDLKFHDIPNTVRNAVRAAADLGVALLTIHAFGGRKMIEAAREGAEGAETRIVAVTVLTSLTDKMLRDEIGLPETSDETSPRLARLAVESGAHGVVSSPREILRIRHAVGDGPIIVTPGIRPKWSERNDQARVMTPHQANAAGSDFIVVGRPIIGHKNPAEAVSWILEELEG